MANLDLAANLGFAGKLPRQKPWRLLIGGRIRDSTVEKEIESSAEGRVGWAEILGERATRLRVVQGGGVVTRGN